MAPIKLKIKCRIEEVPAMAGFLINSMQASLADFIAYSPDYNAAYMAGLLADLSNVEALINPKQVTGELKLITARMVANRLLLKGKIDFLEGYINRATGLTMGKKDFGVSAVRQKNNNNDVEGLLGALNFLLANTANNMTALTARGYSPAQHAALIGLRDSIKSDNIAQNTKLNERNANVVANYAKINALWDKLLDISDAGKRIYKTIAPNRVEDFTMVRLKARMRQERLNTRFEGTVSAVGGGALDDARIEMIPMLGGRRRTARTTSNGKFAILSMMEGEYMVTVSATHKVAQSVVVQIVSRTPLVMDFELA